MFDLLERRGRPLLDRPYRERRARLEQLDLSGDHWQTTPVFANGQPLFDVVCERELEGVVAKRLDGRYRPGERDWVKTKNRGYWRWELEREGAIRSRAGGSFVTSF